MSSIDVGFNRPEYLWLLILLPAIWALSLMSLSGLGRIRWLLALVLRSGVLIAIVLCLAEIQWERRDERITVIYLLDQSESIPIEKRQRMLDYAVKDVARHRDPTVEDKAGIIIFGADAKIEVSPLDDDIPTIGKIEGAFDLRVDATNLESALKLAKATFSGDTAKRVVLITDGNENQGDSRATARTVVEDGIGIDVLPVSLDQRSEIAVEKVATPSDVRMGQTFETRVVVNHYGETTETNPEGTVRGKLSLTQKVGRSGEVIAEREVVLSPGKNVFGFKHQIERIAAYTYEATFVPDDPRDDFVKKNNTATAFTNVRGKGRVLMIENWKRPGQFDHLINRLQAENMSVDLMPSDQLFTNSSDLLQYDTVVLANVPRSSGDTADEATNFSDRQIQLLVENTHELGCGLVMIGGAESFGAGGWSNTELEKAMPVDFQIRNKKVEAVGALVLIMHASEMQEGNYWQKVVAAEAIKMLGPMDYCGVVHWMDNLGQETWLWKNPLGLDRVGINKKSMLARVQRMRPGDMPTFEPSMRLALTGFRQVNASIKHMIIISDGDPSPPSNTILNQYAASGIKISTVAVGTHGPPASTPMERIAKATGGEFYYVTSAKALPKIYQREARRVARPLIFEPEGGTKVIASGLAAVSGIMQGIPADALPPINGYVMTTVKKNSLVEQILIADKPPDGGENSTILATWRFGLGRATVMTTDAGEKWTSDWVDTPYYDKFFAQMIRQSMRPIDESVNFSLATDYKDGRVKVVVLALDENDQLMNNLEMPGNVIGPDLKGQPLNVRQVSPGRYVGEFPASQSGSYLFTLMPQDGGNRLLPASAQTTYGRLSAGVNVPYSSEYNDRQANRSLLETLARFQPVGGAPGRVLDGDLTPAGIDGLLQVNTFRRDLPQAVSRQDVWNIFVVIAACLFLADIFVRRVAIGLDWVWPLMHWIRMKVFSADVAPVQQEQMARLQSQKAAVNREIERQRASTRFEPEIEQNQGPATSDQDLLSQTRRARESTSETPSRSETSMSPGNSQEDDYTQRLLAAKRRAQEERRKGDSQ